MDTVSAKAKLEKAKAQIDSARVEIEQALVILLREAVIEIAAQHPGHEVSGVSAMGSWDIVVYGVEIIDEYGDEPYKKDIRYGGEDLGDQREHEALTAFDNAWNDYQTYPTIRFDVDVTGKLTSTTDW